MNDQVEEVKQKVNIVEVVSRYVSLKKMGRHHKGLCPFHSEKTPSFLVNEELGLYKCFGCGVGGDVIKFMMEIEAIDFLDALEKLASEVGVEIVRKKDFRNEQKSSLYELMSLTARYYSWLLESSKAGEVARKYLTDRKINNKVLKKYGIGFSLNSWDSLKNYLVNKKGYQIDLLEKAGLVVRKNSGGHYDKFRGRLMFPLCDSSGKVVGFTGRVIPGLGKSSEPKYLNSPETEIYHKGKNLFGFHIAKQAIREKKLAVLVEGQMDQISSYMAGVSETVAVGGTGITEDQIEMLARLAETIVVSLDSDSAGYAAMKRTVHLAERRGMNTKVVLLDGGKDPDEIARKSPNLWRSMVDNAVGVYDFVVNRAFEQNDAEKIDGLTKILDEVGPFLKDIENKVVKEVWLKRLAAKLGVSFENVVTEVEKKTGRLSNALLVNQKSDKEVVLSKVDKLTKMVVANLFLRPTLRKEINRVLEGMDGSGAIWKLLVFVLKQDLEEGVEPEKIMSTIPSELRSVATDIYMELDDNKMEDKEVMELVANLAREKIKAERTNITEMMNKASRLGDKIEEEKLFLRLRDLGEREKKLFSIDLH